MVLQRHGACTAGPVCSIAATYLSFPGAAVLGTMSTTATCKDAGLTEGVNCNTVAEGA